MTELNVTLVALRYAPLVLLICDSFANRIYLPITVILNYSIVAYSLALLVFLIRTDVEEIYPMPELRYFSIEPARLAWYMPVAIMLGVYCIMRYKFWYIDEGDEVFNFNAWAKQANLRLDFIENDGVLEPEQANFKFEVDADEAK